MDGIIPKLSLVAKEKLYRRMIHCRDAALKQRYLMIVNLTTGRSPSDTARALGCARISIYRVAHRFCQWGEAGLCDGREDNGCHKLSESYLRNCIK